MTTEQGASDPNACQEYNRLTRRRFMAVSSAAVAAAAATPAWLPRVAFAQGGFSRDVIVCIYLRGGADGLSLCVPYGDPGYYANRPLTKVDPPGASSGMGAVDLDGFFGFAPSMQPLLGPYQAGHLLVVHATGSTDPTRSHFDAQKYMELGKPQDSTLFSGWIGRHIAAVSPRDPSAPFRAVGIGYQLQLALAGAPGAVSVPDLANFNIKGSTTTRAARLAWLKDIHQYQNEMFRTAASNTQTTIDALASINAGSYLPPTGNWPYPATNLGSGRGAFSKAMQQTAALIRAEIGVEAVAIDLDGWDLHSALGPLTGSMANQMAAVANTLRAFYEDVLINAQKNVTVVVMSEFGRRVAENASAGVDHGHGNVFFAMGRQIIGGRVLRNWPGLGTGQLYQNLDLQVTIDHRDLLAEIVSRRLGNTAVGQVFPGYTPTFRNIAVAG
ncbi:MAG: DUF1501 domain-containing protein [Phycisphaerales bacterium]|nr:DUF1501 domain-containing protein [Phycisphaerales bacterium]